MYKPKKGHVVAVEFTRSYHSADMKRTEYKEWVLGRAARVNRKGVVEAFTIGDTDQPGTLYSVDWTMRVAVIGDDDMRAAADKILAARGAAPFKSADELKDMIRSAA